MKSFTIGPNDAGQRADRFITKAVPSLPKTLMYKYLRLKRIKCNGKRCEISTRLSQGDVIEMYISDEFFLTSQDDYAFLAAPTSLSILYEDENILLADKPAGLVVHEDDTGTADTLINRIQHYLYEKGEYRPQEETSFAPALCNRIDRNTEGIVIAAKTAPALRILNQKVKDRELKKYYLCIVHGHLDRPAATLRAYLRKDSTANQVEVSDTPLPGGRTILTKYRVLREKDGLSLVEVDLITGRTHQIRAHFAHIGHPLLGDGKYGFQKDNRGSGFGHQALCAYKLEFRFTTDAGELEYLNGRSFQVSRVAFAERF